MRSTSISSAPAAPPSRMRPRCSPAAISMRIFVTTAADFSRSEERRVGKECRSLCDWSSDVCSSDLIDIVGACRAAVEDASAMFPGCDIHADFCDDCSGFFDRVRIQQMVTNLLINAAQHGAQDKPIELSVTGDTTQLVIAVKNFGAVISAADLGTMFEPLVQLENGDTERVTLRTSLGLGLFIASETAIAHGGVISATSTEHDGTVMTVRLPRQPGI